MEAIYLRYVDAFRTNMIDILLLLFQFDNDK